ncbi:phage protein NinX family protein [Proteus mirabilis]|uniref:phage protein NinX family protein n=1 Tax=Proteus mirabilis TaxID=584 RepID=UPI000D8845FB|nr:phage protein NinX family protein [Proteus mirabilis]SPY42725.1 phage recombination protein [Proteus mirabilis]
MNKYTELSDFEINLLVAQSVLPETQYDVIKQTMDIIQFLVDGSFGYRFFDPCNNPSDAMPIINEYGISLIYQDRKFQFATNDGNIEYCIANPLKAAMIILLCMKDAENEG